MEGFLEKREALSFTLAMNIAPKKESFVKFYKSEHREFWLLPNKKKHGPEVILCNGVATSQRTWKDGFLDGEERNFTYRGKLYETRTWKMGIRHGRSTRIYEDRTSENWWEDGKLVHGTCISDSGAVLSTLCWGTSTSYRPDGTIYRIYSKNALWNFTANGEVKRHYI
ncbi:hypothetical protein LAU_0356 [Lausannevirus]|uniref:MORN repeat-containing protein n=2 Tax=Lausannevirus TaxID=999883 RepID=A0A0N9PZA0_9VIRU|nr:hypothetical protein LAU_0356 [Lausannevirus]AEA07206.1 hypothetical protein LAU_0356 [Lausannevirus]ALH07018.1 hypothetical protein PMV_320 [Port-miou virus]